MYYTSFRIRNYKGIKDTTIWLNKQSKTGVFAFVGLNESGKTSILEAIHSFSPDEATSELLGSEKESDVTELDKIPRHLYLKFTDNVSVAATVKWDNGEREEFSKTLEAKHQIYINGDDLEDEICIERVEKYDNSRYEGHSLNLLNEIKVRTSTEEEWQPPSAEQLITVVNELYSLVPDIAYFPTFVFDFPEKVYLTNRDRGGKVNRFYCDVFQDILDYHGGGLTIKESVTDRIRGKEWEVPAFEFFEKWRDDPTDSIIRHVMLSAGAAVTTAIFGKWNEIYREDPNAKKITISHHATEGERINGNGSTIEPLTHDIYIEFNIADGVIEYEVKNRSLGFRWFFAFMLFTQLRVARENAKPILFLIDEPAANLHAAAQQKLLESFPRIATGSNMLAYTTHSHYMIEPKWLEQTFIVVNRDNVPPDSLLAAQFQDEASIDIKAISYREFANNYPDRTNYFQPILDRLEVKPTSVEFDKGSIVVEGKSDYYILKYITLLLGNKKLKIIPGLGAGTFGPLVALHVAWGMKMFFLFDGNGKGKKERERYISEFGLAEQHSACLDDLVTDVVVIEDLLDETALQIIAEELNLAKKLKPRGKQDKRQILRFFQEALATNKIISLGDTFTTRSKEVMRCLQEKITIAFSDS